MSKRRVVIHTSRQALQSIRAWPIEQLGEILARGSRIEVTDFCVEYPTKRYDLKFTRYLKEITLSLSINSGNRVAVQEAVLDAIKFLNLILASYTNQKLRDIR